MTPKDRRNLTIELAGAAALLGLLVGYMFARVPGYFDETQGGDFPFYVEMANAPVHNGVPAPWRYRPLNPLLASLLIRAGASPTLAFFALTFAFAVLSIVLMRIFIQQLSVSSFGARAGALLFAVSVGGYIPLRRYHGYPDALTNCLILLVLMAVASRRVLATALALGIGSLAKETMLLLVPFAAWRLQAPSGNWRRIALVVTTPVAVYLVLRLAIPLLDDGAAVALSVDAQIAYWRTAMIHGWVRWLLWAIAYSMGPLWLLAAWGGVRNRRFLTSSSLYLVPLLAPLLRTTDTERALMLSFPIVFPLAASLLDVYRGATRGMFVAGLTVACQLAAQLTYEWAPAFRLWIVSPKDVVFLLLCTTPVIAVALTWPRHAEMRESLSWPDTRSSG